MRRWSLSLLQIVVVPAQWLTATVPLFAGTGHPCELLGGELGECPAGFSPGIPFYQQVVHGTIRQAMASSAPGPHLFVDVGAHDGVHTLYAARQGHRVIAYEPNPGLAERLRAKVAAFGFADRVSIRQVAASTAAGGAAALRLEPNDGQSYIAPAGADEIADAAEFAPGVPVETAALDEIAEHVLIMKIDVQGHELHAILGAQALLNRSVPFLLTEFWPAGLRRAGTEPLELLYSLETLGCQLHLIHFAEGGAQPPVLHQDEFEVFVAYLERLGTETDVLCYRELFWDDRVRQFISAPLGDFSQRRRWTPEWCG